MEACVTSGNAAPRGLELPVGTIFILHLFILLLKLYRGHQLQKRRVRVSVLKKTLLERGEDR